MEPINPLHFLLFNGAGIPCSRATSRVALNKIWGERRVCHVYQAVRPFAGLGKEFVKALWTLPTKRTTKEAFFSSRGGPCQSFLHSAERPREHPCWRDRAHRLHGRSSWEAFGLSSLIGRERYIASAGMQGTHEAFEIQCKGVRETIEADPVNSLVFFRRLAGVLGGRCSNLQDDFRRNSAGIIHVFRHRSGHGV